MSNYARKYFASNLKLFYLQLKMLTSTKYSNHIFFLLAKLKQVRKNVRVYSGNERQFCLFLFSWVGIMAYQPL